jgi:hypothetical protein
MKPEPCGGSACGHFDVVHDREAHGHAQWSTMTNNGREADD